MRRRSRPGVVAVVLAVLAVTAGCNGQGVEDRGQYEVPPRTPSSGPTGPDVADGASGPAPGNASGKARASTVTTVDPVDDPPDPGSGPLVIEGQERAPGVTGAGVEDPERLATAHRAVLSNRSYRLLATLTVRYDDGSTRSAYTAAFVAANGTRQVVRRRVTGAGSDRSPGRSAGVLDPTVGVEGRRAAADAGGGGGCGVTELADPTFHRTVERVFRAAGATAVWADPDDAGVTRITAAGVTPASVAPGATDVRNLSAAAVVDARGVVRYLRVSYRATIDGTPATVTTTLRVVEVGTAVPGRGILDPAEDRVSAGGPDSCR